MNARRAIAALALLALAGCGGPRRIRGDDQPTLASLSQRQIKVAPDDGVPVAEEQTLAAYRKFLQAAPEAPQRAEAMRRLGDLEMDRADRIAAGGADAVPDYRAAVAEYQRFLAAYPQDARTDRVLYQLARAQEQGGDIESALKTLGRLVAEHPGTMHAGEAQFRRGELLFAMRDYRQAEAAYTAVLQGGEHTPFHERALYMQGWSQFKQGRPEDALRAFFGVLDLELGELAPASRDEADLAALPELKRADRELVEDTFRVMSISLAAMQGADSIEPYIDTPLREGYQFRVYRQLGELYIRQQRIKDAADTFSLFVRRQPLHAQAPLLQARVVEIYEQNGFDTLALQAKQDHVQRYGADSGFRRYNPTSWERAQPLVEAHLVDLARHAHAAAQKTHDAQDVRQATHWYRTLLASFPDDAQAQGHRFLLAELLFENQRWAEAATEYETVAYQRAGDARGADAGYAALLAYAAQEHDAGGPAQRAALQRTAIDSALRYAQAYPGDARTGAVLTHAADQLFGLGEAERASAVARSALALNPPPAPELRRTAWSVIAHQAFEHGDYAAAERAYGEVLALMPADAATRGEAVERQAAAIYKQGEAAHAAGDAQAAVGHFERVASLDTLAPTSGVRASAQFDAAATLLGLHEWARAAAALEDFRRRQPEHPLQSEVAPKLALAYLELGRAAPAAAEFERVAAQAKDPELARGALWQAVELRERAAQGAPPRSPLIAEAIKAGEHYLQLYPQPLEAAVDARWRLAALQRQDAQPAKAAAWLRAVQEADRDAGSARTERTRTLGGQAALALAEPLLEAYRKVLLVEPLAPQLKLKKARMEELLRAYAAASEVEVAEVTTAATFQTAALYQDFGKALLESARPKKLGKAELEQYDVMLEEQAFPFEEKAIALHETNARRAAAGRYDPWVQRSYAELAKVKPVRWGKSERGDAALPTDLPALAAALQADPRRTALHNQIGIAERRQGHFDRAQQAYETAIAIDPTAAAPQLNLAILYDLYLGDAARAAAQYERCLELSPADAPTIAKWLAELKSRKPQPDDPDRTTAAAAAGAATVANGKEPQ